MKCPKCKGTGETEGISRIVGSTTFTTTKCPVCDGTGERLRSDGIDYNRKIAVPEHKVKS